MKMDVKGFLKKTISMPMVILLVIVIAGGSYFWFRNDNGKPKITNETIGVQIKEIKEMSTIQYKYKQLASREDWNTLFNIKLPFTKSSFILTYTGVLKLGIDFAETKIEVDDETNSIFNSVKIDDYAQFTQSGKENAEADARESGVFEQSKEVAKKIITELLNTTKEIKEKYKIVFE